MTTEHTNDRTKAGQIVGGQASKVYHGPFNRYCTYPVHTRFDAVVWFTLDAEAPDDYTGLPTVIRQAATKADAMTGLEAQ
jgi:hypothetical protein